MNKIVVKSGLTIPGFIYKRISVPYLLLKERKKLAVHYKNVVRISAKRGSKIFLKYSDTEQNYLRILLLIMI
jgi:hypothetical protein